MSLDLPHPGPVAGPAEGLPVRIESVIAAMTEAQRRRQLRHRLIFAGTWALLTAVIVLAVSVRFNIAFIQEWGWYILQGAETTILLTVLGLVLACTLALVGALGRLSGNAVANGIASFYVSVIRGTPLLVQIFVWALGLAELGLVLPLFWAGVFALGVNYGAYLTEIFRAGIQAVPRGQREAAQALGMPERLVLRRVVLPQAFRIVVPAIGNDFIAMIKDTSLVVAIGVQELLFRASTSGRRTVNIMEALLFAALVYWVLTFVFSLIEERLERRMARGDR